MLTEEEARIFAEIFSNIDEVESMGKEEINLITPDEENIVKYLNVALTPPNSDFELKWGAHKTIATDDEEDVRTIENILEQRWVIVAPCLYPDLPSINGRIEHKGSVLYMRAKEDVMEMIKDNYELRETNRELSNKINDHEKIIKKFQSSLENLLNYSVEPETDFFDE